MMIGITLAVYAIVLLSLLGRVAWIHAEALGYRKGFLSGVNVARENELERLAIEREIAASRARTTIMRDVHQELLLLFDDSTQVH
jgi:hypothetical protein